MDIITAIKSGRPFRRKEWASKIDYIRLPERGFNNLTLAVGDILATDWEIEEPKVEITESEFWNKVRDVYRKQFASRVCRFGATEEELQRHLMGAVAKELFGKK